MAPEQESLFCLLRRSRVENCILFPTEAALNRRKYLGIASAIRKRKWMLNSQILFALKVLDSSHQHN